jgi:5'-deoxynucleotidase YfbR-like HD superfamily hydrolase
MGVHGLVHDLTEAVMGDIATPIKDLLPDYRNLYRIHENYWMKQLNLPELSGSQVASLKLADKLVGDIEGKLFLKGWESVTEEQFVRTDKYRFYMASKGFIKERIKFWAKQTDAYCVEQFLEKVASYSLPVNYDT